MSTADATVAPSGAAAPGRGRSALLPRLLIAPAVAVVAAMAIYPSIWSLWISLHNWFPTAGTGQQWVGLKNYGDILTSARFWPAMKNLGLLAVFGVGMVMVLGIALALGVLEFVRR